MKHEKGDLLQGVKQGVILQQVNAQLAMNSGIAQQIRQRWPQVFDVYQKRLFPINIEERLGLLIPVEVSPGLWVLNLVGQIYYGRNPDVRYTSYDGLDDSLKRVSEWLRLNNFTSADVHHPLIGCGLGNANWEAVAAIINHRVGSETTLWTL